MNIKCHTRSNFVKSDYYEEVPSGKSDKEDNKYHTRSRIVKIAYDNMKSQKNGAVNNKYHTLSRYVDIY